MKLPTLEESARTIDRCKKQLVKTKEVINLKTKNLPSDSDLTIRIKKDAVNKVLQKLSSHRKKDVSVLFMKTHPLVEDEESILGIKFKNYLNIDSGLIHTNLRNVYISRISNNKLSAVIDIFGKGKISISGKYKGIPASTTPQVELLLKDDFKLNVLSSGGRVLLKPDPKDIVLKTKIYIDILGWKLPLSYDLDLQLAKILKPILIPIALNSNISFLLPSADREKAGFVNVPFRIIFENTNVSCYNDMIEYRTDARFERK